MPMTKVDSRMGKLTQTERDKVSYEKNLTLESKQDDALF